MLTLAILQALWPNGDDRIPGLRAAVAASSEAVFGNAGITADVPIAHVMAQFSEECGGGTEVIENPCYSANGLVETWPSRFDAARAAAFAYQPQRIANEVYGGRMGNRPGTDDGWNFRGRGPSQVTGRDGYDRLGRVMGLDLVGQPDLVLDRTHFLACGVADFVLCGCLPYAMRDDLNGVTYHLNGGYIGLPERRAWLSRWKTALSPTAAAGVNVWLQRGLNTLGLSPMLTPDGAVGPLTLAAVHTFQQAHGLPPGPVDQPTIDALTQALADTAPDAPAAPTNPATETP